MKRRIVNYKGEDMYVKDASRASGICVDTINSRYEINKSEIFNEEYWTKRRREAVRKAHEARRLNTKLDRKSKLAKHTEKARYKPKNTTLDNFLYGVR